MKIDLESTVTIKVILTMGDLNLLNAGEMIVQVTEGQADEKPMYICVTKEKINE